MTRRLMNTETKEGTNNFVKVYWDSEWEEYRCRLYVDGVLNPEADYFTADKTDAEDTAIAMLKNSFSIHCENCGLLHGTVEEAEHCECNEVRPIY